MREETSFDNNSSVSKPNLSLFGILVWIITFISEQILRYLQYVIKTFILLLYSFWVVVIYISLEKISPHLSLSEFLAQITILEKFFGPQIQFDYFTLVKFYLGAALFFYALGSFFRYAFKIQYRLSFTTKFLFNAAFTAIVLTLTIAIYYTAEPAAINTLILRFFLVGLFTIIVGTVIFLADDKVAQVVERLQNARKEKI